jgi:hypothetical protein
MANLRPARSVERGRFTVGKYDIVAEPMPYARHMLRYTVYLGRTRIGSAVSMPSESDCRFMEKPPIVPPLKTFYVTSRPGRPKKDAKPPAPQPDAQDTPTDA